MRRDRANVRGGLVFVGDLSLAKALIGQLRALHARNWDQLSRIDDVAFVDEHHAVAPHSPENVRLDNASCTFLRDVGHLPFLGDCLGQNQSRLFTHAQIAMA
jgi:hypothetical protein